MSELKAITSGEIYNIIEYEDCYRTDDLYYTKVEVDKVIAEKDKEIDELQDKVTDLLLRDRNMALNYNNAVDALVHNKYKRCLDNAWLCLQRMELFHELVLEEARTIALPNEVALKEYRCKRERAAKWHKRWLKIAEQFKEA